MNNRDRRMIAELALVIIELLRIIILATAGKGENAALDAPIEQLDGKLREWCR